MSDNKYTLTIRAAAAWDKYIDKDEGIDESSSFGHLWYVLHENGQEGRVAGFRPEESGSPSGAGIITDTDERRYIASIPPITIQITQQQFNILNKFGDPGEDGKGANAKAMGFDPANYNGTNHNCVHFVYKALELAGLGHSPQVLNADITFPKNAINYLRSVLVTKKAIEVNGNKLSPLMLKHHLTNEPISIKTDYKITGYDDNNDEIWAGEGNDTLIGKSGDDILNGGKGDDILEGGDGYDIYYVGGEDTIIDSDGEGEIRFLDKNGQVVPESENGYSPTKVIGGDIVSFAPGSAIFKEDDYRFELGEETLTITQESTGHKAIIKNSGLNKFVQTGKTGLSGIHLSDIAYCYDGCEYVIKTYYDRGMLLPPPYMMTPNESQVNVETEEGSETPENKTEESKVPANTFVATPSQSRSTLNMYSHNHHQPIHYIQLLQADSRYIQYRLEGNDLLLFGYNVADSLLLKGFYNSPNNQLQNFQFSDRTLSVEQMKTEGITLSGTKNDDVMYDWNKTANTTFRAGKGNDKIYAGDGDDTLIGGEGNDLLQGGNGKDTYVFEPGHGQDTVTEFNTSQDDDTLQFNDINFNEVKFRRDNYDLTFFGYNEQDSVTIKAFFADRNNQPEHYQFADRTLSREALTEEMIFVNNQVERMVQAMNTFGAQSAGGLITSTQEDMKTQWQLAPSV